MQTMKICLATVLTTTLIACSNDDSSNGGVYVGDASTRDASTFDGSIGDGGAGDGTDATVSLSDGQIAGVMMAANTGEIQEGQLAQTKATAQAVVAFAGQMVTDHTKSNDDLTALEQTITLTAESSTLQAQLQTTAQQTLSSLQKLTGSEFDTAYVQAQVEAHTQVLLLLDQSLIPTAQNAQLKAFLQTTRATVASHLQMAQMLAGQGGDGGADAGVDGDMDADAMSAGD